MLFLRGLLFAAFAVAEAAGQQTSVVPVGHDSTALQRVEVGVLFNNLGLNSCAYLTGCNPIPPHLSPGAGFTVNLNRSWAVDISYAIAPGYVTANYFYVNGSVAGGRGSQALTGARYSLRTGKMALFGYGKAGAVIWSKVFSGSVLSAPDPLVTDTRFYASEGYLAMGAGAGFEYSPKPRIHLRASVGTLVVDYRRDRANGCGDQCAGQPTAWDFQSDLNAGVYVGFGRTVSLGMERLPPEPTHRFFDKTNLACLSVSVLAQTADGIGTQHFIHNGYQEQDGLARPLIDRGWPGQIAAGVLVDSAEILAMYTLHRLGHHRLERLLPIAATGPSAYAAYGNLSSWDSLGKH